MSTPSLTSDNRHTSRQAISGQQIRPTGLALIDHAIGVKLAVELNRPDRARRELDALLDALVVVDTHLSRYSREEPT